MFDRLRWQLLQSYLGVFATILAIFAIAVRLVFGYSLRQSLSEELVILAKVTATHAEIQNDRLAIGDDFTSRNLVLADRQFEWFDRQQRLVNKIGNLNVNLPLKIEPAVRFTKHPNRNPDETVSAIVPIIDNDRHHLIGYVQITQSLDSLDRTFHQLDIGLGIGTIVALIASGGSSLWLTRRAMKPTIASYQQLQQFSADAAHELRSPLMAVKTNANTALKYAEGMRSGDLKKFQAIASATDQIINLTEDLLILARAETGQDLRSEAVDLSQLLNDLVSKYQDRLITKCSILTTNIQPDLLVRGSAISLTRAFVNLVENAIHYTPSGGNIKLLAHRHDRTIAVEIVDTGVGIATTELDKIFERFWRADRSRSRWAGGAGLGLAIVKSIVEGHGGSISVRSKLGEGSQFTIELPAIL